MSEAKDFLFEIGTEELPSRHLFEMAESLAHHIEKSFKHYSLRHGAVKFFATPRRLAILVDSLSAKQPDQLIEMRGPAAKIAYNELGELTTAAIKFAESCGVDSSKLERLDNEKGSWVICRGKKIGNLTVNLIPEIVKLALKNLHLSRQMRWGKGEVIFVRPVHWIVLLYGSEKIDTEVLGVKTGNTTFGHRFMSSGPIVISEPKKYEEILEQKGKVIPDFSKRLAKIRDEITAIPKNGTALVDEDLMLEVCGLVEWPVALVGNFESKFLEVPKEVLITCLQHQQRCFPVVDSSGKLLSQFVVVSNIESQDPQRVILGNERVIRARLSDAEFFYRTDLQYTLDSYLDRLKLIVFQDKLGSVFDRTQRLIKLIQYLAAELNIHASYAARSALLAKCDLLSTMVWEFPELQGIMGYYYALQQFEPDPIAIAIKEQYLPRHPKDKIPSTDIGVALAIADRVDYLVGLFGINKIPTGEKDPLGIRRAAIGILRIILEKQISIDLKELLEQAKKNYQVTLENQDTTKQIIDFIYERFRASYLEQGGNAKVFNAVLSRLPTNPWDFKKRLDAVNYFITLPEAESLSSAHKRVMNILSKAKIEDELQFKLKYAKEDAEVSLAHQVLEKNPILQQLCEKGEYKEALKMLAELKPTIDRFFDEIMVMVDKEKVRNNRLALLKLLADMLNSVADVSLL